MAYLLETFRASNFLYFLSSLMVKSFLNLYLVYITFNGIIGFWSLIGGNAYKAVELLGLPEGRIPLAQAVIYVARAPKSNETVCAIDAAISDITSGKDFPPPMHLRDAHYKDASKYGFGIGYVYSHEAPEIEQQFLPDELINRKYTKGQ